MSVAEQVDCFDEPETMPALSLVEQIETNADSTSSPSSHNAKIDAIASALSRRVLPIEIFEGIKTEEEMITQTIKYGLVRALPIGGDRIRQTNLNARQISITNTPGLGPELTAVLPNYSVYRDVRPETVKQIAHEKNWYDVLWPAKVEPHKLVMRPEIRLILDGVRKVRMAEQKSDAIAVGRDFYIATGCFPEGEYLRELQATANFPIHSIFKNLFPSSEFQSEVRKGVSSYERQKLEDQNRRQQLIEQMENASLPEELFFSDEGHDLSIDRRLEIYARYLIASKFIIPETLDERAEVEARRVAVAKADYTEPGSKPFHRKLMDRNLLKDIDGASSNLSSLSRADIEIYARSIGVADIIDPQIEEDWLKYLTKVKERVDEKLAKRAAKKAE